MVEDYELRGMGSNLMIHGLQRFGSYKMAFCMIFIFKLPCLALNEQLRPQKREQELK